MRVTTVSFALVAGLVGGCQSLDTDEISQEARLSGAIFTTTADGSRVNANIYDFKEDVYLDGGPGGNAKASAAGLPAGDYYFMVTDPPGKVLLSTDDIESRRITLDENGGIIGVSRHVTGIDIDHGYLTVQLMPYADTPNNGGVYKAWVTPVENYDPSAKNAKHGFINRYSKTDNFKVRRMVEPPPPPPPVCGDGNIDAGEECDDGNSNNGDGCENDCSMTPPPPPPPVCGDGHVDAGEQCDDGNRTNGDGCENNCNVTPPPPPPPSCGDGHVDNGEACDDGNNSPGDGCEHDCTMTPPPPPPPVCGDGHVDAGEECDDGNSNNSDGCDNSCCVPPPPPPPPPVCGDGHVDPGEECDDGNDNDNDSCKDCKVCVPHS